MENLIKDLDTSFAPFINQGSANDNGFFETTSEPFSLSEQIKNNFLVVNDWVYWGIIGEDELNMDDEIEQVYPEEDDLGVSIIP